MLGVSIHPRTAPLSVVFPGAIEFSQPGVALRAAHDKTEKTPPLASPSVGTMMGTTGVLSHNLVLFREERGQKKVNFLEARCQFKPCSARIRRPRERRQLDRWGHLKLDGTKTLVEEQPRAGRDAGCIVSIPAVCQRVSLTLEEPVTLTTCISPPTAWGDAYF